MTALLTDNLPLLAGAPNGIKKLRELILELAVRGKLVEQDASDEPASELLKRIAAEKERLVAEGKIKKQKPLTEIFEADKPFELPVSWEWCRLAQAVEFVNGFAFSSKDFGSDGTGVVKIGDIQNNELTPETMSRVKSAVVDDLDRRFRVEPGDLLIAMSGATTGKLGFNTTEEVFYLNQRVGKIIPICTNARFVFFDLTIKIVENLNKSFGSAIPNLSTEQINDILIALPPLAEQHRIVAKVDELMALCDRLEAQQADAASAHAQLVQALLGSLTQASDATEFAASWQRLAEHFHTLFSTEPSIDVLKQTLLQLAVMGKLVPQDPNDEPASELLKRIQAEKQRLLAEGRSRKQKELLTENIPLSPYGVPNGWEWEILDSILYITGGVTLGRKLAGREMVSKPYLRVANVQRGHLALDVMKEVEVPEDEVSKYLLKNGDLLITEGGDWDKVGRTAVWRNELPECLHQNHVFRARALTDEFESRWAEMYLNSTTARDYFAGSSKQTTNLASINMTQLRACAFPMPPLAEQHRIVAKVDQLMALCDQLKTQLSQARQLNQQLVSTLVEQAVA
jgi:type I restriction enzyme S subunit